MTLFQSATSIMCWWYLIELTLMCVVLTTANSSTEEACLRKDKTSQFLDTALRKQVNSSCALVPPPSEWKKPVCKTGEGCDVPLECFNFSAHHELGVTKTLKVTPRELESILENSSASNVCAVVMFYAPYCPYSVEFAQRFNALGRCFRELPVLAVDLTGSDPYKYLAVYVPLVNFYYRGSVIYRFKVTESFEDLLIQIELMTKFAPLSTVDLNHPDSDDPVPTVRVDGDQMYIVTASSWVLFVVSLSLCSSTPVKNFLHRIIPRLKLCALVVFSRFVRMKWK